MSQIPIPRTLTRRTYNKYEIGFYCPRCNTHLLVAGTIHCYSCGESLSWDKIFSNSRVNLAEDKVPYVSYDELRLYGDNFPFREQSAFLYKLETELNI